MPETLQTVRESHKEGRIINNLKYLGVWNNDSGTASVQVNIRIQAAWQKWSMFSNLLTDKKAPFNTRRLCFIKVVYNTLLSGMEPFVFSEAELDRIIVFLRGRSTALLFGRAHSDNDGKHSSWSNSMVLRRCRFFPVHLELAA